MKSRDHVRPPAGRQLPPVPRRTPQNRRDANDYVAEHNIRGLMTDLTQKVLLHMPPNPREFLQASLAGENGAGNSGEGERVEAGSRGDAFQISVHAECSGVGLTTQRSSVSRLLSKRNKVEQLRMQVETYDMMRSMLSGAADSASAGSGGAQDQSGAEMLLMMKTLTEELTRTREGAAKEREELRRGIEELQRQEKNTQEETIHFKVEMAALKDTKRELMKRGLIPWEDDNDGTRLPGQWVNVRIFISSSFIDTQAERDMIVQNILPKLNHELAKNFVRVTFVDLRWGVASHESANCEAIQCTCLNEIERCVEISPTGSHPCPSYPFFVCLRTKRKGWVMDTVNKPEAFEKPERFAWIEDEDLGVHDKKLSITELEIYHGLLGRREDNQDCKRVFVYFRDDQEFITEVDHDMRWIFEFEHISEEDVQTRGIADSVKVQYAITPEAPLRRRDYDEVDKLIRKRAGDASSPALVRTYTPTGATTRITGQMPGANGKKFGVGHVTGLQDLERQIYIDLFEAINAQYPKPHRQLNAMALEDMYHQHHITSSKACFGRDDLLCNMMDLLAPGSGVRCPVAVVGLPGSGKTTVMAAFIKRLLEQGEREKDLVVFFHVVASSPQSFSVKNVLTRLCEFLKKRCDLSLEVPTTMAALRDSWMHFVLMAAQKYKVVIVLDAINQLSSEHDALSLSWLPTSLPKDSNIRIVCSMIDKDQQHETMKQRQPETVKTQIAVKPMQRADQERLVAAFLGLLHKSLTAKQMEMLLNKEDAGSPLYLTTACHRLIELGIYEEMDDEIAKLPGRKIPLLEKIIDSMIEKFGKGVIRSTLLFVYFSQGGIFEHELLHLVSQEVERMKRGEAKATRQGGGMSNEGTRLDEFSFSLLYQRLQPLLPTTASGLLQFFHNDMRTLIFKLFLGGEGKDFSHLGEEHQQKQFELQTEEEKQESLRYNRILAEYYLKQVEEEGNHELRTIQSLTAHMVNANMIDELRQFLLLPRVFKVMFSSDLRIEFLSLWGQCFSSRDSAAAAPPQVPLPDPQVEGRDDDDARVANMFRDLDINGDGGISIREFKHFALRLGLANDTIDEEFVKLDADGDGEICESEFRAFFRDKRQGMTTVEYDAFLKQVDQGRVEFISDTGDGPKNLAQWYRESLASDANDIDDPAEEAQVFCLLGDFFLLKGDEAQGLTLDSAESESFYQQALVLDPKATPALIGLSRLERDRKQPDKAMAYLREAMGYLQIFHGYKHIEVARCQRDMAEVCLMQDHFQTAKQVIVKARKIVTEVCGKQSLEYADFMMSEGDVLVDIASKTADSGSKNQAQHKLWKDSIAAYREAIGQQKLVMGEKHPAVLTSYDRLIANVVEQPGMLTEDVVAEFAKPRVEMELSMSGTLQRASAFEWLQMLVQVHAAHQLQESVSSEVAPKDDTESRVATSLWYKDVDAESRAPTAVETQPVEMTEAVKASATMIKPAHNKSLALQVRAGTDALELGEVDGSDNQLWLWHGEEVQHVATGLFLDAEVKYMYVAELGAPWESCGIRLCVRPQSKCGRQRWMQAGSLIQHVVGGHALDVNFWRLEKGAGVNLNAPIVGIKTFYWVVASPNAISEAPAARSGKKCASPNCAFQAHHVSADWNGNGMYCCAACTTSQGHGLRCLRVLDVPVASIKLADLAGEWMRDYHEFGEELVRIAIEGDLITATKITGDRMVPAGDKTWEAKIAGGCILKGRSNTGRDVWQDGYLIIRGPDHVAFHWESIPKTVEYRRNNLAGAAIEAEQKHEPRAPIADIPEGAEFYIKPAANPKRCLSVRSDGYTKDPFEVYLTNVDPSSKRQKWRLVDGDTFQNVESGQFLHSATKYAMIAKINEPWDGNHTDLVTRPQDLSDAQRWVLGPDEFFGGQVLRHYKDGRGVDIHDWKVDDGEKVGCENSVCHECKGISYILEGENFSTLNTKPGRKLRLALRDGRGLALEHPDVDASEGHRAYHIRMTSAAKAIEVEFKSNGEIVVTAGHHHLGFTLGGNADLWEGMETRKLGNRQHFSDGHGHYQWQLNADDGTISPRGARRLVLGWRGHAQLVKRGDAAQLQFITRGTKEKVSFLSEQSNALVDMLSVKTPALRAAVASPATFTAMLSARLTTVGSVSLKLVTEKELKISPEMLRVLLTTETAQAALRMLEQGAEITDEVRDWLTDGEGQDVATPTCALSFNGGEWLWDDGADVPLGNDPYTWELWIRVTGRGCFVGYGNLAPGQANGLEFQHDMKINHWWYARDLHASGKMKKDQWHHLVVRCDGARRSIVLDGEEVAVDSQHGHNVQLETKFYVGARSDFAGKDKDGGGDPFRGAFSEIRLWRRCLADDELAMSMDAGAPPDELVRWLYLTDEDAGDAEVGTVKNHAPKGPPYMTVGSTNKPQWTRRAELGETEDERMGAAGAVPLLAKPSLQVLVLDTSPSCQQLVSALCDRDEAIRAAVQSPAMLLAALKTPKTADAALQLLEVHGGKITDEVRDGLLAKDPKTQPMSMLERLIHDDKCAGLVKALCARDAAIKASVVS